MRKGGRENDIGSVSSLAFNPRNLKVFLALIAGGSPLFAQVDKINRQKAAETSFEGLVTVAGQQGRSDAAPGAQVKLTGASSGPESLSETTDAEGRYRFTQLQPGTYRVEAFLDGFKPFVEDIALMQGDTKIENISLELETVVQKIEVQDKAADLPDCRRQRVVHQRTELRSLTHFPNESFWVCNRSVRFAAKVFPEGARYE